jgi:multiple sugar transport system permease protein
MTGRRTRGERLADALAFAVLGGLALSMLLPFVWMLITALKDPAELAAYPPRFWPRQPSLDAFRRAWTAVPFARYFINSVVVALAITAGQVVTCSLAAYAFARLSFPGRDRLFWLYLATMMVPGQVVLIPNFALIVKLGWVDTFQALILPALFSAYGTFMLRQFFATLPRELEEAAIVDGCSLFGIWWRIVLPLSRPALATLATFTFMGSWNAFLWPLLVTNSPEMATLPLGLATFQSKFNTDWTLLMAGSLLVLAPVLAVYLYNQQFFVKGLARSGIKG